MSSQWCRETVSSARTRSLSAALPIRSLSPIGRVAPFADPERTTARIPIFEPGVDSARVSISTCSSDAFGGHRSEEGVIVAPDREWGRANRGDSMHPPSFSPERPDPRNEPPKDGLREIERRHSVLAVLDGPSHIRVRHASLPLVVGEVGGLEHGSHLPIATARRTVACRALLTPSENRRAERCRSV